VLDAFAPADFLEERAAETGPLRSLAEGEAEQLGNVIVLELRCQLRGRRLAPFAFRSGRALLG
jgi:hypothetical protein